MSKFIKNETEQWNEVEVTDTEIISIEECDKDIEEFYIDREKIENIKAPDDMMLWVRESVNKAEKDMKKEKITKYVSRAAASIGIVLLIGSYNPVLAHKLPPLEKLLNNINETLEIDEIASMIGIDKIIPKAELDENNKIIFKKVPKSKPESEEVYQEVIPEDEIKEEVEEVVAGEEIIDQESPTEEERPLPMYMFENEKEGRNYIHRMANSIIIPVDGMKYGSIEITPENIEMGIKSLDLIHNEKRKSYMRKELEKWKNGDFSNAVLFHNYIWNIEEGNVGKAKSIDYEAVKEIKNKYFK